MYVSTLVREALVEHKIECYISCIPGSEQLKIKYDFTTMTVTVSGNKWKDRIPLEILLDFPKNPTQRDGDAW